MLFYLFNIVRAKILLMTIIVVVVTLELVIITTACITSTLPPAYARPSVSAGCGPTQGSNLSITVNMTGFLPNTFLHYKYIRSDNSEVSGGFSTGTYGKNTVTINVGPYVGTYKIYIYRDINSYNTAQPIYSSIITLPCIDKHFTPEYYKSHSQIIQYLLGIQSIYNKINVGDYLVASSKNALNIFNSSTNSNIVEDQLAAQLLAAELNKASGVPGNCIDHAISSANSLLKNQNYNGPTNFPRDIINKDLQPQMLPLKDKVESYNRVGCFS
jgi:hypothetical protein